MQVIVSAPGKVHLMGEHSVVYGHPALLTAVDRRVYVKINLKSQISNLKSKENVVIHTSSDEKLVSHCIDIFKKKFSIKKILPVEISITSQIPMGSGMGSSAALSAAIIGALMKYVKNIWNPTRINEITFEVEKYTHGNPSGADNSIIVFGGLLWFRREFDFLTSIWSLPMIKYTIPQFFIIDSGKPYETTKEMVEYVAGMYKKNQNSIEQLFSDQEKQTKNLLLSFKNNNLEQMKQAIYQGERNIEKMGIVGKQSIDIIRTIESYEGVAKVTGAGGIKGGSGMLLCYHRSIKILQGILKKFHVSISEIACGGEGIRLEANNE